MSYLKPLLLLLLFTLTLNANIPPNILNYSTTQTDAKNATTQWSYDKYASVASRTLPLGQGETIMISTCPYLIIYFIDTKGNTSLHS